MSVEQTAALHIVEAYRSQDLNALNEWISKFPEGWTLLSRELGDLPLKDAIERRRWRMIAFLLDAPTLPEKIGQMSIASKTADHQLSWLIEGHFNKLQASQLKLALFLQERILW